MKKIWLAGFFFIPFCVYLFTLHPAVSPYRDSGDLIVAASTLGIAHPPGYPLYLLTGKIFTTILNAANRGYAMNVMSALFAAAGLFFAALAVMELTGSMFACLAVFLLAFSPAYWRLAQVSEMYSLNAFLASALIYFAAMKYGKAGAGGKPPATSAGYFLSFACGLAAANHPTIVFIFPGFIWLVYGSRTFTLRDCALGFMFFAAGISVELFMLVRAAANPLLDWGKPETLTNFLRVITRADYGGLKLHPEESQFSWTAGIIAGHLTVYLKSLAEQFTLPAALLGAWGMFLKRKDRFYRSLFLSLVISGPLFIILSNLPPAEKSTLPILEPHLVLPNLIFTFFIAAGVEKSAGLGFWAKAAVLALIAALFLIKLPQCSYREHFYADDYGRNIFRSAPPGSIIYDPDDPTAFITTYMQAVSLKRPDIRLAAYFRTRWGYELLKERHPDILPAREIPSGRQLALELLDFNRSKAAVFAELPGKFPQGYLSYPEGLLYRLSPAGEFSPSGSQFSAYALRGVRRNDDFDFFTNQVISYYSSAHNNIGLSLAKLRRYDEARAEYFEAMAIDPDLDAALNNMGSLEYSRADYPAAEKWFLRLLRSNPDNSSALYNAGITYRAMKKTELAVKYLEPAWLKYYYPDAGNELGLIALENGKAAVASEILSSVTRRYPQYALAYFNQGLSEKALGNYKESRRCFELYLRCVTDAGERAATLRMIGSLPR